MEDVVLVVSAEQSCHFPLEMAFRLSQTLRIPLVSPCYSLKAPSLRRFSVQNSVLEPRESRKLDLLSEIDGMDTTSGNENSVVIFVLILEVKEKLEREHFTLPVGKNGRDDEDMILWFLQDRKFAVDEAVSKLTKAIKWRHEFGVHNLSEDAVKGIALTGKAYVHESFDINNRPVLIVVASKHFPAVHDPVENERLCVFLIEKTLGKLPCGQEEILGIFDLRGFGAENADLKFLTFIFEVFYYYYPKRLGQVLFVEAPFVFKPIWQLAKPLLKSYASLVRFCSVETVRTEYFTEATVPASFRD